jgi:hypothetical protein
MSHGNKDEGFFYAYGVHRNISSINVFNYLYVSSKNS